MTATKCQANISAAHLEFRVFILLSYTYILISNPSEVPSYIPRKWDSILAHYLRQVLSFAKTALNTHVLAALGV